MKMYRIALLLLLPVIALTACKEKDPVSDPIQPEVNEQWGFALYYTRTDCGSCGGMGAPRFDSLKNMKNVVAIAAHIDGGTDPMYTPLVNGFSLLGRGVGFGIPDFYIGDKNKNEFPDGLVKELNKSMEKTPDAVISELSYKITGTTMNVKVKVKFLKTMQGEFYLSPMILESNIQAVGINDQVNQGDEYTHDCVLRTAYNNVLIDEVLATDPVKDETFVKEYPITINPNWNNDLYPAVVLYQKTNPTMYKFVNGKIAK